MKNEIKYNEFKAISEEHGHTRAILTSIELCEEADTLGYPNFLETEVDDAAQTIISSPQYSNSDVADIGWETVKGWINEDNKRLREFGRTWWMVGVLAKATIHIPSKDGNYFFQPGTFDFRCLGYRKRRPG